VAAGNEFEVSYTLRNRGDRAATRVEVVPEHPAAISLIGRKEHKRDLLQGSMSETFRFRALRAGFYRAALFVSSGSNHPGVEFDVRIEPASAGWTDAGSLATRVAGVVFLTAGALILVPLRRRAAPAGGAR